MAHKFKIGSVFTGIGLGSLIGWFLGGIINANFYNIPNVLPFMVIGATIFGSFAYKKPVFVEYLGYAFAIYIILQAMWDSRMLDWNVERATATFSAVVLLITNSLTGHVKLVGAKNTFKKAIGL